MPRDTLLDFFADWAILEDEFLVWDDGYRTHQRTYKEVASAARGFAAKLRAQGIGKGEKVVLWGENRPEWIAALWGCLLEGVIAVPIDFRSSADFVKRVARIVEARAILVGDSVDAAALGDTAASWRFGDFDWATTAVPAPSPANIKGDDIAEIVFTSGATAEPKGVIITHRNLLSNIVPVETRGQEVSPLRTSVSSGAIPESAAAEPSVRADHGDLHSADDRRHGDLSALLPSRRHRAADQLRRFRCWCRCPRSWKFCAITSCATSRKRRSAGRRDPLRRGGVPARASGIRIQVLGIIIGRPRSIPM